MISTWLCCGFTLLSHVFREDLDASTEYWGSDLLSGTFNIFFCCFDTMIWVMVMVWMCWDYAQSIGTKPIVSPTLWFWFSSDDVEPCSGLLWYGGSGLWLWVECLFLRVSALSFWSEILFPPTYRLLVLWRRCWTFASSYDLIYIGIIGLCSWFSGEGVEIFKCSCGRISNDIASFGYISSMFDEYFTL